MDKAVSKPNKVNSRQRHAPFIWAGVCAVASFGIGLVAFPKAAVACGAVVFFAVYLVLIGRRIPKLTAQYLKTHASGTDEPAALIFAVTLATVVVAIGSLFLALNDKTGDATFELILAFSSVALGWLTIHTMAAMHYAHRYWSPEMGMDANDDDGPGLSFPGDKEPCGLDFLYFSLVIGMTAQTSDVEITSTEMRCLNLVHAVVSFFFNTVLVAAAVNAAVSLA